jgi:hypothetical protein
MGQKYPKRLRLPAGKNTYEHMGEIMPGADSCAARKKDDAPFRLRASLM